MRHSFFRIQWLPPCDWNHNDHELSFMLDPLRGLFTEEICTRNFAEIQKHPDGEASPSRNAKTRTHMSVSFQNILRQNSYDSPPSLQAFHQYLPASLSSISPCVTKASSLKKTLYDNGDSRLCENIWTLLKFLQQLEPVEESEYREPTTFIASAYMQIQCHCPWSHSIFRRVGWIVANSMSMSWSERVLWKIWSAIIGPFFLFSWRNYISCIVVFQFVYHNISLSDWIAFLEFFITWLNWLLGNWLIRCLKIPSCTPKKLRPLCTPKFLPVFEVISKTDSDIGHVHSNVVVLW